MSTTLAPPPPPAFVTPPAPGGRRPATPRDPRWAWRLLRREWRQQVLVLALLTVAVAATTVGLGLVVNVQSTDQALVRHGRRADRHRQSGPEATRRDLAAAKQAFRHRRSDRARERAGARIDHSGRSARPGSARRVQQADAAPGLGQLPQWRRPGGGDRGGRDDVPPRRSARRWPVNGRTAAGRRHRREPQEPAGRLRPGGSGADQLPVQRDAALRLQWISGAAASIRRPAPLWGS